MTPKQLGQIEARAALGTPLTAEIARQDIPALCAALREAWRERDALLAEVRHLREGLRLANSIVNISEPVAKTDFEPWWVAIKAYRAWECATSEANEENEAEQKRWVMNDWIIRPTEERT